MVINPAFVRTLHKALIISSSVVSEGVSLVISRQILTDFTAQLSRMQDNVAKEVSHYTLDKIQARVISFEEQVCVLKIFYLFNCQAISKKRYDDYKISYFAALT